MRKLHLWEPIILEQEKESYNRWLTNSSEKPSYIKRVKDIPELKNVCDGKDTSCKWFKDNIII